MDIALLIKSGMGLIVVLGALIFFFLYSMKKKKTTKEKTPSAKSSKPQKREDVKTDLKSLRAGIRNRKTSEKELKVLLDLVLKHHGKIHAKLGIRAHPEFDSYMEILMMICRHPNTNKNLIVNFDKELIRLNPSYKVDINDAVTKGLNSRGV